MMFTAAFVTASALIAQTPEVAPPEAPSQISVRVVEALEAAAAPVLDRTLVIDALRLRWRFVPVDLREGDQALEGEWLVELGSLTDAVVVRVVSPTGEVLLAKEVSARNRRPYDLAHTVALLIAEAMRPVLPPAVGETGPAIEITAPPPLPSVAAEEEPRPQWSFALGPFVAVLAPRETLLGGGELSVARSAETLATEVAAAWWQEQTRRGASYRVTAQHGTLELDAGALRRVGKRFLLRAVVGPAARLVLVSTRGEDFFVRQATYVNVGVAARLVGTLSLGSVSVSASLGVMRYYRHELFVVDGVRILNLGHTNVRLGVALGRDF